jgi:hypothetical protein
MQPQTLDPASNGAAALAFRAMMSQRVEEWRADYAALMLGVIATAPRARVRLWQDLEALAFDRDHLIEVLDQLATTAGPQWVEARSRTELAWSRLMARTEQLDRRIRRSIKASRRNGPPRPPTAGSSIQTGSRPARPGGAGANSRTIRLLALRCWAGILAGWGNFSGNEAASLAGVRYRLIADLESCHVGTDRNPAGRVRTHSSGSGPAERGTTELAFAGDGVW